MWLKSWTELTYKKFCKSEITLTKIRGGCKIGQHFFYIAGQNSHHCKIQRWSRGHKARGQGQEHKKYPRTRPRTTFPRTALSRPKTGMLEAKAKDRGHRRKRSPKKKVFKNIFQAISNSLAYPKFLIKAGLNHKSHDMTSSKFFQRTFCGT